MDTFFVYDAFAPRSSVRVSIKRMKSVKKYLTHYAHLAFLGEVVRHSGDPRAKQQAQNEMKIAERKLKFWERQENFDMPEATRGIPGAKREGFLRFHNPEALEFETA